MRCIIIIISLIALQILAAKGDGNATECVTGGQRVFLSQLGGSLRERPVAGAEFGFYLGAEQRVNKRHPFEDDGKLLTSAKINEYLIHNI